MKIHQKRRQKYYATYRKEILRSVVTPAVTALRGRPSGSEDTRESSSLLLSTTSHRGDWRWRRYPEGLAIGALSNGED